MRIHLILGIILIAFSGWSFATCQVLPGVVALLYGLALTGLGIKRNRLFLILFGHICIFAGCMLTAWGLYLLPCSRPTIIDVLTRPLFWGLFSIFGGICALFHGFCSCVRSCHNQFRNSDKSAE